ncbi:sigma-70 family RNA polymerase sigma factor [Candidatus Poribacteria bacterium]
MSVCLEQTGGVEGQTEWLNQIAVNSSRLWLRDQGKHQGNRISLEENVILQTQEPEYHGEKLRQQVWDAIDELAEDHREVVILHYVSGYTYKEIGEMLSVPFSTVSGRLQKAKDQLRKEFLGMVSKLQLEVDSTVHKFLTEYAKRDGLSVEGLILRLIERYKRDIDKPEVTVRQVWEPSREPVCSDFCGAPSPDGRYLSFTNYRSDGNLAVRDLTTGECRDLTDEGTWDVPDRWAGDSIWSPDGKQIAYAWFNEYHWELHIVGFHGSKPRVLYRNEKMRSAYKNPHGIRLFTWSQDGEYILATFYRNPSPDKKVWTIVLVSVADGSVRVLKSLKNLHPGYWMCLAPDGRYVAYARPMEEHEGARDIFLLAADGSGKEVPLVEHPADDYAPVWSPDEKTMVFVSDRSGVYDAWFMQMVDGKPAGEPQLIKRGIGPILPMGFTQEGSLYYGLCATSTDVYIATMDPATGKILAPPMKITQRFEGFNHSPAWSPDGKSLAYVSLRPPPGSSLREAMLVIRSLETGKEREIHSEAQLLNLRWSPDGHSILCGWRREALHLIDVQTGNVTPIIQFDPADRVNINDSAWAPDGKTIFYIKDIEYSRSIMARDLETGRDKELCREGIGYVGLAVSPDGRQIAFTGEYAIKVMPAEGGEPRELLHLQRTEELPLRSALAWTADGRYVLPGISGSGHETLELCCIPAEGGEPEKLLTMEEVSDVSVHPDGQRIAFTGGYRDMMEVWTIENFLNTGLD